MTKFFLKKNFCDNWDSLFFIILSNLIPTAILAGSMFAIGKFLSVDEMLLPNVAFVVCFGIFMAVTFAWGANARKLADFNVASFGVFFRSLKSCFFTGFFFGILVAVFALIVRLAFSYYLVMYLKDGSMTGLLFAAIIGWFTVVVVMALQWFIPLYFLQEENSFVKCFKKSFIIFFDNAYFSIGVFLLNAVLLVVSIMTFGLIPGINGITLTCTNALRLRLYKYDWLEEHPEFLDDKDKRNEVPWDELIQKDVETLGPRSLGSFLFPWK